jgi:phage shock protein E
MGEREPHSRRTIVFSLAAALILALLLVTQFTDSPPSISAKEASLLKSRDSSLVFLDVRTEEEFLDSAGHLEGALLIPLQAIETRIGDLASRKEQTIVVYCRSGQRSKNAVSFLRKRGFHALNLEGGILKWKNANYPVKMETHQ